MNPSGPSVSVIVPTFNCKPYLEEALRSAISQGTAIQEVIVVDDGSTDGTSEIGRTLGPPVRVLRQDNRGPAAARNLGMAQARGDYFAFLDGDDVWLPGKIEAQTRFLASNDNVRFVFGNFLLWTPNEQRGETYSVDEKVHSIDTDRLVSGWIYPDLLLDSVVHTITVMFHRSVYEAVGAFDESLRTGEDYDYWLRVSRQFEMHKLAKPLARYRLHAGSITKNALRESNELKVLSRALERFGDKGPDGRAVDSDALRRRFARLWFDHGHLHYWNGDYAIAADAFKNARAHESSFRTSAYQWVANFRARFMRSAVKIEVR
jgi:glycosyltransferase involved in cell wall biosynthesis